MKYARGFLVGFVSLLTACAGKTSNMQNVAIQTIPKLRVGIVELSSHDFNIPFFFECMKNIPSSVLVTDGQTRRDLESSNWYSDNLIASLRSEEFEQYARVKNFSLLLLIFKNKEQKSFVRAINFLSRKVRTFSLSEDQFSCENVLDQSRVVVVESIPPYADVYIDDRKIGETPVWTSLKDGTYEVQCKLPDDVFPKGTLKIPGTINYLCKRNNQSSQENNDSMNTGSDFGDQSGSVLVYSIVGLGSIGLAVLPYFLFFR